MKKKFYTEIDLKNANDNLKPILIRNREGHELINNYRNLYPYFKHDVKLAMPDSKTQGGDILGVKYLVSETIEPTEVSPEEFNSHLKAKVLATVQNLYSEAGKLGSSRDDRQKAVLLKSFQLWENFDLEGYKHIRKVGSDIILTNWGFRKMPPQSIDTTGYGEPELEHPDDGETPAGTSGPDSSIIITSIECTPDYDEQALGLNARVDTNCPDLNFSWNIAGQEWPSDSQNPLRLSYNDLRKLDDEFPVKVQVEDANDNNIRDEFEEVAVINPLKVTAKPEDFPKESANGDKIPEKIKTFWERYKTLILVALFVLIFLILLLLFLNRDTGGPTGGVSAPGETATREQTNGDTQRSGSNGTQPDPAPPVSTSSPTSPRDDQDQVRPYDNRIDETAPLPATSDEFEEQRGANQKTPIGTVYEYESDDYIIRWIELNNGQTFVLDYFDKNKLQQTESAPQGNIYHF